MTINTDTPLPVMFIDAIAFTDSHGAPEEYRLKELFNRIAPEGASVGDFLVAKWIILAHAVDPDDVERFMAGAIQRYAEHHGAYVDICVLNGTRRETFLLETQKERVGQPRFRIDIYSSEFFANPSLMDEIGLGHRNEVLVEEMMPGNNFPNIRVALRHALSCEPTMAEWPVLIVRSSGAIVRIGPIDLSLVSQRPLIQAVIRGV